MNDFRVDGKSKTRNGTKEEDRVTLELNRKSHVVLSITGAAKQRAGLDLFLVDTP